MKRSLLLVVGLALVATGCGDAHDPVAERDAVSRWVLSNGGHLVVSGSTKEIKSPHDVPSTPYDIEKITLNESRIADADLSRLRGLRNLKSLSLYRTNIGDKGLETLVGLTSLTELELSYTRVTDDGIKKLSALKNLRKLFLRGTGETVTAGGVKAIHDQLPACEIYR